MEKQEAMKFCKHCGGRIPERAIVCTLCGCQVEELTGSSAVQPQVIINNSNRNTNVNRNSDYDGYPYKRRWTAFFLCLFLGGFGAHRFYVGKAGTGILWLCTAGFFGIGWVIDFVLLLFGGFRDKAGYPLK